MNDQESFKLLKSERIYKIKYNTLVSLIKNFIPILEIELPLVAAEFRDILQKVEEA